MNFFQIISEIEKVDPEVYDRLDSRRSIFKNMAGLGQKLTAAAIPLAVGAIFNKAYAQTPVGAGVNDVLNFALKLEYLESYFYNARTAVTGLSAANRSALDLIATDEANHVTFLRAVLGSAAIAAPATTGVFDFTGGGRFNPTDPTTYLALAQSLEDTGVRAYKGAAPLIMANKTVLTAALNIHSVEARHASQLRAMRRAGINSSTPSQGVAVSPYSGLTGAPKSWISGTDGGGVIPTANAIRGFSTAAIYGAGNNTNALATITYAAEDNVSQGGVTLSATTLTATAGFPATAYSEAFDEGLDVGTVAAIANNFSVSGTYFN
ncbi:ferritin-like domain-containing protein [Hymenobacter bucti]|uniref:Ferritin-like domain-containing protein n=1 Tax=Hymenobacter bucti TaxID=1844114 RepID=A0ABW4QVI1_9BACT